MEGTGTNSGPRVHSSLHGHHGGAGSHLAALPSSTGCRSSLIVAAYAVLHELADNLEPGAHVEPQLGFDEWVFGGVAPTVRLQRELWDQGNPHWYDYTAWLVYLSHFVVTLDGRDRAVAGRLRGLPPLPRADPHGHLRRVRSPTSPTPRSRRGSASIRGDMPHTVRVW